MTEKPLAVIVNLPIIDDSCVRQKYPDTTLGKESYIYVNNDTVNKDVAYGYIKVDLSAIPQNVRIVSAILYMSRNGGTTKGTEVYLHRCYNDDWSEKLITWNNWNPPYESEPDDALPFVGFNIYATADLTKTITECYRAGKRVASFKIIPVPYVLNYPYWSSFNSKEAIEYIPYVEVTLELAPPTHTLSIGSSPVSGVPFTIDVLSFATPFSSSMDEGTYIVTMPSKVTIGGVQYEFVNWADGVTTPSRTINLTADMSLTANYRAVVPTHIVTVRASPEVGVPATVDGQVIGNTPVSVEVVEGDHVFSVPSEVEV